MICFQNLSFHLATFFISIFFSFSLKNIYLLISWYSPPLSIHLPPPKNKIIKRVKQWWSNDTFNTLIKITRIYNVTIKFEPIWTTEFSFGRHYDVTNPSDVSNFTHCKYNASLQKMFCKSRIRYWIERWPQQVKSTTICTYKV